MKVLVVATNPRLVMQVTAALLGQPGLDVTEVAAPKAALALLDAGEHAFDIVVADADLAPEGGFALAREMKSRAAMGRQMPPIVMCIARDVDRHLANWSQADAYVRKPIDAFDLREVVRAVAAGEPVPVLPGVGGEPTPSLLSVPRQPLDGMPAQDGGLTGGGP